MEGRGHTAQAEVRRILRERDQLKEATSQMETELIQVHMGVWGGLCVSVIVYTVQYMYL